MFKRLEFVAWLVFGMVRSLSSFALRNGKARRVADRLDEFVRRLRRAGLLFIAVVGGLLACSLAAHSTILLLWLMALPLAGFGALLSLFWPTRRLLAKRSSAPDLSDIAASTYLRLARSRSQMPLSSRPAFDCVVRRLKSIDTLSVTAGEACVIDEAKRLTGRHLPRLVESYLALPPDERTEARTNALVGGLEAIAEELGDIRERLVALRTDRFEIERQFIATRFPRNGLASL